MTNSRPALIIDTNVVLNRWLFHDVSTITLLDRLASSHRWVGTQWMLAEALRVAAAPHLAKYRRSELSELESAYRTHIELINPDTVSPLRCRDPDDQAFLNLAEFTQAPLLLTLDRDLLKLRKRAATLGLQIVEPLKYQP